MINMEIVSQPDFKKIGSPETYLGFDRMEYLGSPDWSSDGTRLVYRRLGLSEVGPVATIESRGLTQISDAGELEQIVAQVLADNPDQVGLAVKFQAPHDAETVPKRCGQESHPGGRPHQCEWR